MNSEQLAQRCAHLALDKKALDLRLLRVAGLSSLTDYLVLATGNSDRQVQAIAENIRMGLKEQHDITPLAIEGMNEGRWVLLDYGDAMVHVFQPQIRSFYDLEGLWAEAAECPVTDEPSA
ncbi:MAG: ribosome silencing factor [Desulfuromonadaceae bacterium]|nr:ribosome silencing factor [Desulfuromonadaceae bacterium]